MFWNENKLILEKNIFNEGELLEFEYFIKNQKYEGDEFLKLFNNNFSLKSLDNNEVIEQPKITQKKYNSYIIQIPSNLKKEDYLQGLLTFYFTDKISVPIELNSKIQKYSFKVFYYDWVKGEVLNIDEIKSGCIPIYIYQCQFKKKETEHVMHFRVELKNEEKKKI